MSDPKTTNDSAPGPFAGYLFQLEKGLLVLAELENSSDYITIEKVDDVAAHNAEGMVTLTLQSKHSLSVNGSGFADTSLALWRTLEIWIAKLEKGVFDQDTSFVCCTNQKVDDDSILAKFKNKPFTEVITIIEELHKAQKKKLKEVKKEDRDKGSSITKINKLIKYALDHKDKLELIKNKIKIEPEQSIKDKFLNRVFLSGDGITETQADSIYHEFYGWISSGCLTKWRNGNEARFTKKNFDSKYIQITRNSSIINAIFRAKEAFSTPDESAISGLKSYLFVKQIEDIDRNVKSKERIIKKAILDFFYADIELKYVIEKGDYTKADFDAFLDKCLDEWQEIFDSIVIKETSAYTTEEKNDMAIRIFREVMETIKLEFKDGFCFTTSNEYVRNGCFLKLSNEPMLGWHPEWELKYKSS